MQGVMAEFWITCAFILLLQIQVSQQCKGTTPPDNSALLEAQGQAREQELKLWCFENCVSEWSGWSPCDSLCGRGKMTRERQKTKSEWCNIIKEFYCTHSLKQQADCNLGCPDGGRPSNHSCVGCPLGKEGICCETEIFCGIVYPPENGDLEISYGTWPAKLNALLQFSCNAGYSLVGDRRATCQSDGTWSRARPRCKVIQCTQPALDEHVKLHPQHAGYSFQDRISFYCEEGYELVGENIHTCMKGASGTGVWSGVPVRCEPVRCSVPELPEHGRITTAFDASFKYKDNVQFACDTGYKLVGADFLQCLASGQWFGHQPKCEDITCDPPFPPRNGQVKIHKAGTREYAEFECDEGYHLEPDNYRLICSLEGTWDKTAPKCIVKSCGDPGAPENGYIEGGVFTFGSVVTLHCQRGYEMKGRAKKLACGSDGRWNGTLPTCEACPVNFYLDGEACSKCPPNSFTSANASTSIQQCLCDVNRGFAGPPGGPCEEVFCAELQAPENGNISQCGNKVFDSCQFLCNDGFVVERGSTVRACQNIGEWSGTQPFCAPCRLNTYKSGERVCFPCPLHSHTDQTNQMLTGCVCDDGYEGLPGGPCTDVNECENNSGKGPCADTCENAEGDFRCRCTISGYKIDPQDELSCIPAKQCHNLTRDEAPGNGSLVCHWYYEENAQHCATKCNPGFDMATRTNDYETCGPTTGYTWSFRVLDPNNMLNPCIPEFFPEFQSEAQTAYFVAACENLTAEQQTIAKEKFAKTLNDNGVCAKRQTKICNIKDMAIICGRTTRRRKRRDGDVMEQSLDFAYNISALKFEDKTAECHSKICPMLRIPADFCDKLCQVTYKRYLKATVQYTRRQLEAVHKDLKKQRNMAFTVDNLQFEPAEDGFRSSEVIIECPSGMMTLNDQCVPCTSGSYLNEDLNECIKCPANHFQNKDLQTTCIPCKVHFGPGYNTNGNGSTTCQLCPEGRWGEDCINHCDCAHGSCSPFDGQCICLSGWEGPRCETDMNSCVPGSCYPGVTCVDEPPPGTGFSCGPCPAGYHGDGLDCSPISNQQHSRMMAFEL